MPRPRGLPLGRSVGLVATLLATFFAPSSSVLAADPSNPPPVIAWFAFQPDVTSPFETVPPWWLESGALLNDVTAGGGRFLALGSWQHIDALGTPGGGASGGHNPIGFITGDGGQT